MNTDKSKQLFEEAKNLLPGGVDSPVRAFKSVGGTPLFMKEGKGSHIIDEDGNEYIDYCMSWGPMILGHADGDVLTAVTETAKLGTSFGTPHRNEVELAKLVIDAVPSMEKVRFVSSGTEATMSAIRLARGFTGRDKIIKLDGCYHGHADFLLVAAGSGLATFGTPDSAGVTEGNAKDTLIAPYNDLEAIEKLVSAEKGKVAALILEPVPCNYGLILPKENYLRGLREICNREGIVLIFDEVINGFRISMGGAQEYYGVKPDLTTLGKIIGAGLPVGAYGGRADIMAQIAPEGPVYQAGTLSGNPLAMAAGTAALKKLKDTGAHKILREKAELMNCLLLPLKKKYEGKVLVENLGSIYAFYFTDLEKIKSVDQVRSCNMEKFAEFHKKMLERGIYLSPSGYEVAFLSTAHSDDDIKTTVEAMELSLTEMFD